MTNPISALPLRAARWSATHPWRAILGWLALVAVAVGLAIAVPTQETDDADYRMGDSGRADAWVDAAGLDDPSAENVLVTAPDGTALDPAAAESAAADLVAGLRQVDGVETVTEPQWSPDRTAMLVAAQLARDQEDPAPLQAVTDRVQADHPGLSIRQAGDLSLDAGDQRPGGRGPLRRRGHQPAGHAGPDAARLRRARSRPASPCCSPSPA